MQLWVYIYKSSELRSTNIHYLEKFYH